VNLTKDRFSAWENKGDKGYNKDFDDELVISVRANESSIEIADYILMVQEKAKDYIKMERMVFDLTKRLKKAEENSCISNRTNQKERCKINNKHEVDSYGCVDCFYDECAKRTMDMDG
jgi:hypothetical protein